MTVKGENGVKKAYNTPRAEKLNFDYKKVVVASGGESVVCSRQNDQGNGHGCLKPGHARYNDIV